MEPHFTPGPSLDILWTRRRCLLAASLWPLWGTGLSAHASDAVEVLLAGDWSPGRSPHGYLVSEKFDGVRAIWDGQQLRFRSGRPIAAPAEWLAALPRHPLDGELWLGYGEFNGLSGRVRRQSADPQDWRGVQYLVFDAPGQPGPFEERWQALGPVIEGAGQPWLRRVRQERLPDTQALDAELARVVSLGGEGLVLHRADAPWQAGRSGTMFKYKPEPDAEAKVLGYRMGQGRLSGQVGALWVETTQGLRFALGSGLSDAQRRSPPPVGSWVTYRYRDLTPSGLPRFPTFVRVRPQE